MPNSTVRLKINVINMNLREIKQDNKYINQIAQL